MADKIEADAPSAPQVRKQIADAQGNFHPLPADPPKPPAPPAEPEPDPLKIGDSVTLGGRVLEIQHTQGGQTSVKVQLANGAVWLQGGHLTRADNSQTERIGDLERAATADQKRIGDLEKQLAAK